MEVIEFLTEFLLNKKLQLNVLVFRNGRQLSEANIEVESKLQGKDE